jgi:hypothetical protein
LNETTYDLSYKQGKFLHLAVDFLPCELALDASSHFSSLLKNWVEILASSDKDKPLDEQGLPAELKRAVFICNGKLTPNFEHNLELYHYILSNQDYKKKVTVTQPNFAIVEDIKEPRKEELETTESQESTESIKSIESDDNEPLLLHAL